MIDSFNAALKHSEPGDRFEGKIVLVAGNSADASIGQRMWWCNRRYGRVTTKPGKLDAGVMMYATKAGERGYLLTFGPAIMQCK